MSVTWQGEPASATFPGNEARRRAGDQTVENAHRRRAARLGWANGTRFWMPTAAAAPDGALELRMDALRAAGVGAGRGRIAGGNAVALQAPLLRRLAARRTKKKISVPTKRITPIIPSQSRPSSANPTTARIAHTTRRITITVVISS